MSTQEMLVRIPGWEQYRWLRHGFSTRFGGVSTVYDTGDLNLDLTTEDNVASVETNRRLVVNAVAGVTGQTLVTLRQVHGTKIVAARREDDGLTSGQGHAPQEADGVVTNKAAMTLGIQVADCVPVLVADVRRRVVAAFHAGWRGTAASIVPGGIRKMHEEFGSSPEDLIGAVGPSIRACCYSVGQEVREAFCERFSYADQLFTLREGLTYLDLAEANRRQMLDAGMNENAISIVGECTGCTLVGGRRKYFSHRMEGGFTGRAMGVIGMADEPASCIEEAR